MNNLSAHLSDEELARYCGQRLPPAELLVADRHLALCDDCYGRMGQVVGLADKLALASKAFSAAAAGELTHLTYEQLAALVDGQLDDVDQEIAQSHLEHCPACATALGDLREVSSASAPPAARESRPARQPSFRDRVRVFWRLPALRPAALAAAAVAGVALVGFLLSLPLRQENAKLRAKVTELEQHNQGLRDQAAAAESLQGEVAALREENHRLRQSGSGAARITLNDGGGQISLDGQGNLTGVQTDPGYEQAVKQALQRERIELPAGLAGLRGRGGTLMGSAGAEFKLLNPVGVVIETDRPTLRWGALEGATGYTVAVFDSNLTRVAASDSLTGTQWTAPPLRRGETYVWQVRALKEGREVVAPPPAEPRVKFKVLEQAQVEQVERARRAYANSHLIMGTVYARAGLLAEAEREFSGLVKANPESPVARKLLQSVRAAMR